MLHSAVSIVLMMKKVVKNLLIKVGSSFKTAFITLFTFSAYLLTSFITAGAARLIALSETLNNAVVSLMNLANKVQVFIGPKKISRALSKLS